jgi:hypothetical protein
MAEDYDRYIIEPVKETETLPAVSETPATVGAGAPTVDKADAGSKAPKVDAASTPATAKDAGAKSGDNNAKYHEAGFDAFITGQAYLRFAGYILKERQRIEDEEEEHARKRRRVDSPDGSSTEADAVSATLIDTTEAKDDEKVAEKPATNTEDLEVEDGEVEETEMEKEAILEKRKRVIMENPTHDFLADEELQEYYNKLHVMRSDFPILDLAGPDPEPEDRPYSYLLRNVPASIQSSTLFHLFEQYNPYTFSWSDDTTAWLQISKFAPGPPGEEAERVPYEPKYLPLGRLGEEYVKPFYEAQEMGIDHHAADIEILTWKQWYEEREARERQQREATRAQRESQASQNQQFRKNALKKPFRAPYTPPGMTNPPSLAAFMFVLLLSSLFSALRMDDITF